MWGTKITSTIGVSWNHILPFWSWLLFNSVKWPYYQKDLKYINSIHPTLWILALPVFEVFVQFSLNLNLSLNQTLLTFLLYVRQIWMTQMTLTISLWRVISFNLKGFCYSYAWSCSICEGRTSYCTGFISRNFSGFLLTFLTGFTSLIVLLLFPLSITFFVFMHGFWCYFI